MATITPDVAYAQIKALEAQGQLQIHPLGVQTVLVGTWDANTSLFSFAVPTEIVTEPGTTIPGQPVIKPMPVQLTAGAVIYAGDTLMLQFDIVNSKGSFSVTIGGTTVTAAAGQTSVVLGSGGWVSKLGADGSYSFEMVTLRSGTARITAPIQIFSLPLFGAGALTLPAVPVALIYAPPVGPQSKNYAVYTDVTSISQKIETSVVSGASVKTATAYTQTDFLTKIGGLLSAIAGLGGEGSALRKFLAPIGSAVSQVSGIVSDTSESTTNLVSTTTDHAVTTTVAWAASYQTPQGAGPGVGDRFVYIRNVRIAWVIFQGQLSFTVLGDDGVRDFTARELSADATAMAAPGGPLAGPVTGLDAGSVRALLSLDLFVGNPLPTLPQPRFEVNDPASIGGGDTGTGGDMVTATHEITTSDTTVRNTVWTQVTDYKPGWLSALFGTNQSTENQMALTCQSTVQTVVDDKQTVSVYFFTGPNQPAYLVGLYYDTLFNTLVFTPWPQGQVVPGPDQS